ncbi:serine/threonine-protein kinase [Streptomyces sp. NPDC002138]|uniref:serine/threonine-protein kinase n=1 Tax=Streptomyces sp. NPDC002138 TaxID=3154410 RepID=UPI00331706E8
MGDPAHIAQGGGERFVSGAAFAFPGLHPQDPDTLGEFRLVARLGEGGMGQVFLALSPGGQSAAVKVIRSEFARDAQFAWRFTQEVRTAQRVRGAYLAPLLDADPNAERPWLATTYVAGPSLRDLVTTYGPLPTGQVMLLAFGIAHALSDIHAADVVHRDLKPGNILLDETGVKVIDFGIVKSLTQSMTYRSQSTRIGTPLFMSPEQAMGRAVGPASDMFAFGSTLFSLASASEAFAAENEWGVAHRIVADEPDLSHLDPPLRRLVAACLDKDPEERPTALEARAWCERELGDAFGPGAWMDITGARESIQQRNAALRAFSLHGAGAPGTATSDRPGSGGGGEAGEDKVSRDEHIAGPRPTGVLTAPQVPVRPPVRPPVRSRLAAAGGSIAAHLALVVAAAGALVWAAFLPIMSEYWTDKSSGHQVAHLNVFFHLHDPWTPQIPVGVPDVASDWVLAPVSIFGTALALVCCALLTRTLLEDPVKGRGGALIAVCMIWLAVVAFFAVFLIWMQVGNSVTDDNPAYNVRSALMPGGWLVLLANGLTAYALQRMHVRDKKLAA